jgi:hypothetical protein
MRIWKKIVELFRPSREDKWSLSIADADVAPIYHQIHQKRMEMLQVQYSSSEFDLSSYAASSKLH